MSDHPGIGFLDRANFYPIQRGEQDRTASIPGRDLDRLSPLIECCKLFPQCLASCLDRGEIVGLGGGSWHLFHSVRGWRLIIWLVNDGRQSPGKAIAAGG
ncbi:hypothetical protein U1872_21565 [Sphingomonas sp. RB3P16]